MVDRKTTEGDLDDGEGEKFDVIDLVPETDRCRFKLALFTGIERWWVILGEVSVKFKFTLDAECFRSKGMVDGVALTVARLEHTCAILLPR